MTSTQKISVIIPTHNRPDTVVSAVRSVLAQTWRDLELFVIDVGVKDRAEDALREFSSDPRFHYVKHPAELRGGAARNIGVKLAQGQWLAFLDDDDEWFPKKLEIQMEAISRASHDVGFCFSGVVNDFGDRQEITRVLAGEQDLSELAFARFKGFLTVTLMIRRDVYTAVGGFDEMLPSHQDPELILRIAQRWKGIGVDQPLVRVNMHPGRDHVGGDLGRRIEGRKMVLQKHATEFAKRPAILARHWFQIGLWERERGEKKAAVVAMQSAFRADRKSVYLIHLLLRLFEVLWGIRSARSVFPILVSVIIVGIAVFAFDARDIYATIRSIKVIDIGSLALLLLVGHLLSAFRWKYILAASGYHPEARKILFSFFANIPATKMFPAYAGDYLRVFYLRRDVPVAEHAGLITTEVLLDIVIISAIAVLGGSIAGEYLIVLLGVIAFLSASSLPVLFRCQYIQKKPRTSSARNFLAAFAKIRIASPAFAIAVILTALSWGLILVIVHRIFAVLGASISFLDILTFQPAVILLSVLPVSFGGMGVREYSMSAMYGDVADPSIAFAAGIIQTTMSVFVIPVVLLPLYLYAKRKIKSERQ